MHDPPRGERADNRNPAAPPPADAGPDERQRKRREQEYSPDHVGDVIGDPRQRGRHKRYGRRTEKWLSHLFRRQLLLLHRDQRLVVDMRPAFFQAGLAGRDVGVEVDSDGVVADQQIEDEGERDHGKRQD